MNIYFFIAPKGVLDMHPGENQASDCTLQKAVQQPGANHCQGYVNGAEQQNHDGQGGNDEIHKPKFQAASQKVAYKNALKAVPKPGQGKSQNDRVQKVKCIPERIVDKYRIEIFKSDR